MSLDYYTIKEACEITGLCEQTIRRHIRSGDLNTTRKGRAYLIAGNDLQKLVKGNPVVAVSISESSRSMQSILDKITATYQELSHTHAETAQKISSDYREAVRPFVQKATGQTEPEKQYDDLKMEVMQMVEEPLHKMLQNAMVVWHAMWSHKVDSMSIDEGLSWLSKSVANGVVMDGKEVFSEPLLQAMIQQVVKENTVTAA